MQGDLGRGRAGVPQSRRGPSDRFRRTAHRALRRAAQTTGSGRVHHRAPRGDAARDAGPQRRPERGRPAVAGDRSPRPARGDQAYAAGGAARAGEPGPAEEGDRPAVGHALADRRGQRGGTAQRLHASDRNQGRPGRQARPGGTAGTAAAGAIRLRHRRRGPGGGRRRTRLQRARPILRAPLASHRRTGGGPGHPDRQRHLHCPAALHLG